jgi:hypothetical protein
MAAVFGMFRTRTGLAACANVLRRARCALPPPLFRADGQSHPGPALLAQCSRKPGGARTLCPVAAGGARWGRLCVNGWKKSAWSRSAQARSFHARRRCLSGASSGARSEFRGAGCRPISSSEVGVKRQHREWRPSCTSPHRAPPAATTAQESPHPNPLPGGEGANCCAIAPAATPRSPRRVARAVRAAPSGGSGSRLRNNNPRRTTSGATLQRAGRGGGWPRVASSRR